MCVSFSQNVLKKYYDVIRSLINIKLWSAPPVLSVTIAFNLTIVNGHYLLFFVFYPSTTNIITLHIIIIVCEVV